MLSETSSKNITFRSHNYVIPQTHASFYTKWYSDTRHEM